MYQPTQDDFAAYEETQDKFIFCLDLLDLSLRIDGEDKCDHLVEQLEQQFDTLRGHTK
jgi:hypothetical protein